jgi:hypothetical protein
MKSKGNVHRGKKNGGDGRNMREGKRKPRLIRLGFFVWEFMDSMLVLNIKAQLFGSV